MATENKKQVGWRLPESTIRKVRIAAADAGKRTAEYVNFVLKSALKNTNQ